MRAVGDAGNSAVGVTEAVVAERVNGDRVACMGGGAVIFHIHDRRNGDNEQRGSGAAVVAVADRIGHHRRRAVPVGDWREAVAAVAVNGQRADARQLDGVARLSSLAADGKARNVQRVAVRVAVVGQQFAANSGVFRRGDDFTVGHRHGIGHHDAHGGGFGDAAAGDGIGEGVLADVARVWRINQLPVFNSDGAVRALGHAGNGLVRVNEAVVADRINRHRHACVGGGAVIFHIHDRRNGDNEQRGSGAAVVAVADRIGHHRRRAVPVGDWREAVAAVAVNGQRADARQLDGVARLSSLAADGKARNVQRVAVRVAVVGQQFAANSGVFRRGDDFTVGHRHGIGHHDAHGGGFGDAAAGDGIGEGVLADVARVWRINQLPVFNSDGAVRALGHAGNGLVRVNEAVVADRINRHRHACVGGGAVIFHVRYRGDGDGERRGSGAAVVAVADRVGYYWRRAVPVGHRRKAVAAVALNGQLADAREPRGIARLISLAADGEARDKQRIAVRVTVVEQQVAARLVIFRRSHCLARCDRHAVGQGDGDVGGFANAAALHGVGEGILADIACHRTINQLAVFNGHRAVLALIHIDNRFVGIAETVVMQRIDSDRNTRMGAGRIVLRVRHRRYAKGERGGGDAAVFAVADGVGRGRRHAVPVGHWHKGEAAVGADRQIAIACQRRGVAREVAGAADGKLRHGEGVAIVIVGVSQQVLRRSAVKRGVFRRGNRRYAGQTRRHVGDVHGNGRGFGFAAAGDGIGEGIGADVARGVRGINHLAVVDNHGTINALGDRRDRFIAVAEAVVAQHVDGFRLARMGGGGVAHRVRHRCNAHADALRRAPVAGLAAVEGALQILRAARGADAGIGGTGAVGDAHRQAARHRAVVVGQRHKAQLGRGEQHQRVGFGVACAKRSPGRVVGRVLPVAEACVGGVADDRHIADSAAGVAAASNSRLVVGGVAVAAKNRGQRFANWRIFLHGQRRRANRRTVVDVSDAG